MCVLIACHQGPVVRERERGKNVVQVVGRGAPRTHARECRQIVQVDVVVAKAVEAYEKQEWVRGVTPDVDDHI